MTKIFDLKELFSVEEMAQIDQTFKEKLELGELVALDEGLSVYGERGKATAWLKFLNALGMDELAQRIHLSDFGDLPSKYEPVKRISQLMVTHDAPK